VPFKITTWNIEDTDKLVNANPTSKVQDRRKRIKDTIKKINPDIICIQEGPKGEAGIEKFCSEILDCEWVPILLPETLESNERDKQYQIAGFQWIWFLVRIGMEKDFSLQNPEIWQGFTGKKKWVVNYWGEIDSKSHYHYRHPQVLIYDLGDDKKLELVGVHLKSKINQEKIIRDEKGQLTGQYLIEALKARVKLATESQDIRDYVGVKFNQIDDPGIIILGDCNDGPGKDFFELINNIQGDVLIAERFFNHALFDYANELRWTARFKDDIQNIPAERNSLLLDHILMSQPLCRGNSPLIINEHAGFVEHEAYELNNIGSAAETKTSDHRPVSCLLDENS
jgi:endonuclease/exonuclease/phosphatase family metal-dependent hydrolase